MKYSITYHFLNIYLKFISINSLKKLLLNDHVTSRDVSNIIWKAQSWWKAKQGGSSNTLTSSTQHIPNRKRMNPSNVPLSSLFNLSLYIFMNKALTFRRTGMALYFGTIAPTRCTMGQKFADLVTKWGPTYHTSYLDKWTRISKQHWNFMPCHTLGVILLTQSTPVCLMERNYIILEIIN